MAKGAIAFDTCFSLEKPRQSLIALEAPTYALELWFAQMRDAFDPSYAGGYKTKQEKEYLSIYPQPNLIAEDLVTVADKLAKSIVTYT
jgi:hypothetical protein